MCTSEHALIINHDLVASCFQKEILFMASYNQVPLRMLPYCINELGVSHQKAVSKDDEKQVVNLSQY